MQILERKEDYFIGHFEAMASNCEVLIDTDNKNLAQEISNIISTEVIRIEQKYSRYRNGNIIHQINSGDTVTVDAETARLLDYAQQLYQLSDGQFDVTSGVLRRIWNFNGSDQIPNATQVNHLLPLVGWEKVLWHNPEICLQKDMEIDFGGIGKEYAADCAVKRVNQFIAELNAELSAKQSNTHKNDVSVLINLGGDLAITGPRQSGEGWQIAVNPGESVTSSQSADFSLKQGGVATSGNANRYLLKDGVRYSHVLDPRNGWPISSAPSAVTVVAPSCTDAGMLSTMALLQGPAAEDFLREQDVPYWCQW